MSHDEEVSPKPLSKVERTSRVVAQAEAEILIELRDLSVKQFRLRMLRDDPSGTAEMVSRAAREFRTQQSKVSQLIDHLSESHISAIKARADEEANRAAD